MLFYVGEDARIWVHWNHSFEMHLTYLGPVFCVFATTWVSSRLILGSDCSLMAAQWQIFSSFLSFLGLIISHWRVTVTDDYDILVHWYGRKYSFLNIFEGNIICDIFKYSFRSVECPLPTHTIFINFHCLLKVIVSILLLFSLLVLQSRSTSQNIPLIPATLVTA